MALPEKIKKKIMQTFSAEFNDHSRTLNNGFLELENNPSKEDQNQLLEELFRCAHSLKGSAQAVGLGRIAGFAGNLESALSKIQHGKLTPTPEIFDTLFSYLDMMKQAMAVQPGDGNRSAEQKDGRSGFAEAVQAQQAPASAAAVPGEGDDPAAASDPEPNIPHPTATGPEQAPADRSAEPSKIETSPEGSVQDRSLLPKDDSYTTVQPSHLLDFSTDTIRVATEKIDTLMDGVGELLVARMFAEQRLEEVKTLQQKLIRWKKSWRSVRNHYHALRRKKSSSSVLAAPLFEFLGHNREHLKTLDRGINGLIGSLKNDHNHLALLTDNLQNKVRHVRMLPIDTLFDFFPRMVRDLARKRKKEISFRMEGGEFELDRHIIESIKDPMIHLLRNAVDHGIELPDQREKAGKNRRGTILLRAVRKGNTIVLNISDDGAGIDIDALKETAVNRKFLTVDEIDALSDQEAVELVFRSGLSSLTRVTDLSGRGVGLDVVRRNLEVLHGLVRVDTFTGRGTTFTLTLPLTLATSQVLLVAVADQTLAVPIASVERIQRIAFSDIGCIDGKDAVSINNTALPLVSLARFLGLDASALERPESFIRTVPIVILGLGEKRVAFRVDRFLGTQEVVIKTMGRQLRRVPNIAGATTLGDGRVVMILNVTDLLKSAHISPAITKRKPAEVREIRRRNVLVVDDSITTRTLEKNILENAGFSVLAAADGEEAWALIQNDPPDVIVADIDMPRMDGFDLTQNVKNNDRYKNIPVVLVTSMDRKKDRIRGMESGANAYITKQMFEQQALLETIEELMG